MMFFPRNKVKLIGFTNVAKDFKTDYIFLGRTKTGRMRLAGISGNKPEGFDTYRNFMTKISVHEGKKRHWVREGGSPFNSYYFEE